MIYDEGKAAQFSTRKTDGFHLGLYLWSRGEILRLPQCYQRWIKFTNRAVENEVLSKGKGSVSKLVPDRSLFQPNPVRTNYLGCQQAVYRYRFAFFVTREMIPTSHTHDIPLQHVPGNRRIHSNINGPMKRTMSN